MGSLFSPDLGLGRGYSSLEKLSQNGAMPGAEVERSDAESPCALVSRQKSEKQRTSVPPISVGSGLQGQGALGRWHGGRGGPAVLHGRGKWGPSEWQGEGEDCSRQA